MRARQCTDCAYAAYKGEPVFIDCPRCIKDTCDTCHKDTPPPNYFFSYNVYHYNCLPPREKKTLANKAAPAETKQ